MWARSEQREVHRSTLVEAKVEFDNALLRTILDHAPVGIALLEFDRTVRYCNPEFRKIYGWDDDTILGSKLPLPEHQYQSFNEFLEELRSNRSVVGVETVRVRKDGSEFYARISGAPLYDRAGDHDGFVACITVAEENHSDQLELRNLEYLIQSSSDFMCVADLELRVLFINDPGRAMVGLRHDDDINGMHLLDFFADESRGRLAEIFHSLQPTETSVSVQTQLKHLDTKAPIPVSSSVYMVNDPHTGEPISVGCVSKNLTELNELAGRLEGTQAAFRTLMHHVPVGVALVDPTGRPIEANEALQELLGYSEEELKSIPFAQHVHPEDLSRGRSFFLQLAAGTIDQYMIHKRLRHRSGHVISTRMKVFLVRDRDGLPKHTISIVEPAPDSVSKALDSFGSADLPVGGAAGNSATCQ
jgi:PAS domain S-box-containing protein